MEFLSRLFGRGDEVDIDQSSGLFAEWEDREERLAELRALRDRLSVAGPLRKLERAAHDRDRERASRATTKLAEKVLESGEATPVDKALVLEVRARLTPPSPGMAAELCAAAAVLRTEALGEDHLDTLRARAIEAVGWFHVGEHDRAREALSPEARLLELDPAPWWLGPSIGMLGLLHRRAGNLDAAARCARVSAVHARGDPEDEIAAELNLCAIELQRGDSPASTECARRGLDVARDQRDGVGLSTLGSLAIALYEVGDLAGTDEAVAIACERAKILGAPPPEPPYPDPDKLTSSLHLSLDPPNGWRMRRGNPEVQVMFSDRRTPQYNLLITASAVERHEDDQRPIAELARDQLRAIRNAEGGRVIEVSFDRAVVFYRTTTPELGRAKHDHHWNVIERADEEYWHAAVTLSVLADDADAEETTSLASDLQKRIVAAPFLPPGVSKVDAGG